MGYSPWGFKESNTTERLRTAYTYVCVCIPILPHSSRGWEDLLEEGMATHSSILAWRIPMDRAAWWATVHGVAKSWTGLSN